VDHADHGAWWAYVLRKFDFDPAPLVLGLVIAPLRAQLRQSLVMSNGDWTIFFRRPISVTLLAICLGLLVLGRVSTLPAGTGAASSPRRRRGRER